MLSEEVEASVWLIIMLDCICPPVPIVWKTDAVCKNQGLIMRIINNLAISVNLYPHAKTANAMIFQQFTFHLTEQK